MIRLVGFPYWSGDVPSHCLSGLCTLYCCRTWGLRYRSPACALLLEGARTSRLAHFVTCRPFSQSSQDTPTVAEPCLECSCIVSASRNAVLEIQSRKVGRIVCAKDHKRYQQFMSRGTLPNEILASLYQQPRNGESNL